MNLLLTNASIFNGRDNQIKTFKYLYIQENKIKALTNKKLHTLKVDKTIDVQGLYLMPGLIDAHVHVNSSSPDPCDKDMSRDYIAINSLRNIQSMLNRGFTTVRDAGGAGYGLHQIIEEDSSSAPRLFYSGKALSQTGGHGDFRGRGDINICSCQISGSSMTRICDGVAEVRKAAREQLRDGATQLKIMAAGGVSSPSDRIEQLQFSDEEIIAVVDEATRSGTYVMAHVYTPEGLIRCVKLGVRSLEHANLLDVDSAKYISKHGAFIVPTLSIYESVSKYGKHLNIPQYIYDKLEDVKKSGQNAIKIAHKHGVNVGFGTDLLGDFIQYQCLEFELRKEVETPFQTLHSATYKNAQLLNMEGKLGVIEPEAYADILGLPDNPLNNIDALVKADKNLKLIIKDGNLVLDKIS